MKSVNQCWPGAEQSEAEGTPDLRSGGGRGTSSQLFSRRGGEGKVDSGGLRGREDGAV